ncbi:MAG: hypothetical protein HQ564_00385 [Candidatus Saganbacteria bacterium]|nr:hypothetical protein [Candidatus Saganbacteria bacterium]
MLKLRITTKGINRAFSHHAATRDAAKLAAQLETTTKAVCGEIDSDDISNILALSTALASDPVLFIACGRVAQVVQEHKEQFAGIESFIFPDTLVEAGEDLYGRVREKSGGLDQLPKLFTLVKKSIRGSFAEFDVSTPEAEPAKDLVPVKKKKAATAVKKKTSAINNPFLELKTDITFDGEKIKDMKMASLIAKALECEVEIGFLNLVREIVLGLEKKDSVLKKMEILLLDDSLTEDELKAKIEEEYVEKKAQVSQKKKVKALVPLTSADAVQLVQKSMQGLKHRGIALCYAKWGILLYKIDPEVLAKMVRSHAPNLQRDIITKFDDPNLRAMVLQASSLLDDEETIEKYVSGALLNSVLLAHDEKYLGLLEKVCEIVPTDKFVTASKGMIDLTFRRMHKIKWSNREYEDALLSMLQILELLSLIMPQEKLKEIFVGLLYKKKSPRDKKVLIKLLEILRAHLNMFDRDSRFIKVLLAVVPDWMLREVLGEEYKGQKLFLTEKFFEEDDDSEEEAAGKKKKLGESDYVSNALEGNQDGVNRQYRGGVERPFDGLWNDDSAKMVEAVSYPDKNSVEIKPSPSPQKGRKRRRWGRKK